MASHQVADGKDDLQIWGVVANVLNKQSQTVDMRWSSGLGVGRWTNTPHRKKKKISILRNVTTDLGLTEIILLIIDAVMVILKLIA